MTLYNNRYRIETTRMRRWDYSRGHYFITINTKHRVPYFGKIVHGQMVLSEIGHIAYRCWKEIPKHFPAVELDECIIMPDHLHGIVIINECNDKMYSLGVIMNQFKRACTIKVKQHINPDFRWQPRFYDQIINSEKDKQRIRRYILTNPKNW